MNRSAWVLVSLAFLAVVPTQARAETLDAEVLTLGWQTEHAEAAVLADLGAVTAEGASGKREATFAVREVLRGDAKAGDSLKIVFPDLGHGTPWVEGAKHLLFVERIDSAPGAPTRWRPVSGTYGIRVVPASGPGARFPEMVRQIAATLADRGPEVEEPERLLALLLAWIDDGDPGVVWSAATDLVRHRELLPLLTEKQAEGVVETYRRHPIGKPSKHALAMAVALSGHTDAGRALVDSLLLPKSVAIRGAVGDALATLDDPEVPKLLIRALAEADAPHRATIAQALGRVGGESEAPTIQGLLKDDAEVVRIEAAHAVGLVARRVRKDDATARVGARADLYRRALLAKNENELRASLWALAQLDDPEAFDVLRNLAENDERPFVRRVARWYLDHPRTSLVLK